MAHVEFLTVWCTTKSLRIEAKLKDLLWSIRGALTVVLWNGKSGEAFCNWQVGVLSGVLIKLSSFLRKRPVWCVQQQAADGAARSGNLSGFQSQSPLAAADLANSGLLNTRKASWPLHRICVRACTCDLQLHGRQLRRPSYGNWLLSENSGQRRLCVRFTKVLTSCLHHSCTSCNFHWVCVLNEMAVLCVSLRDRWLIGPG